MSALDEARAALAAIEAEHPTAMIAVGSQTHGGRIQYAEGCRTHGAWCWDWNHRQRHLAALRALLEPPTDDEREALVAVLMAPTEGGTIGESAHAILASDVWRNRRQGPITEAQRKAAREAAYQAWLRTDVSSDGPNLHTIVDAALEAARDAS